MNAVTEVTRTSQASSGFRHGWIQQSHRSGSSHFPSVSPALSELASFSDRLFSCGGRVTVTFSHLAYKTEQWFEQKPEDDCHWPVLAHHMSHFPTRGLCKCKQRTKTHSLPPRLFAKCPCWGRIIAACSFNKRCRAAGRTESYVA